MPGRSSDLGGPERAPIKYEPSDSAAVTILLTLAGGLQDAYSYFLRGHVFANAQTGNIVLLSASLINGDMHKAASYMIPLLSFAAGIYAALSIRRLWKASRPMHWRHIVLAAETATLLISAVISSDAAANAMISFSCAMQIETFRHFRGNAYASTMCIGNIRALMENLHSWRHGSRQAGQSCRNYAIVLLSFMAGVMLGISLMPIMGFRTIWAGAMLAMIAFMVMIRRAE